jgi:uncharacterized protein (DUF1501 family)
MKKRSAPPKNTSRREFLRQTAAFSTLGSVTAPFALNLAAVGSAAAQAVPNDYKALVCVFLAGGNDNFDTLIPYDTPSLNAYTSLRGSLARDPATLLGLTPTQALPGGRAFALAPEMTRLKDLFDANKMAVLLNVGPLIEPITKAEYLARNKAIPVKLGSHNDQQSTWQSSSPEGADSGWGGRIGDLFAAANDKQVFTTISVAGNTVMLSGNTISQYQISSGGAIRMQPLVVPAFGSSAVSEALQAIVTESRDHLFEYEHARIVQRAIQAESDLRVAVPDVTPFTNTFPGTPLGAQLRMVARLIGARQALGVRRQVFFVQIGGFDNHAILTTAHGPLLTQVSEAMAAFYQATAEMQVADKVTAFTASDFGRTITNNGDGSDHGWGSFHFVVGGAVRGRRYYGSAPQIADNGENDHGQGRLIPTTSVEQYAATLANWFGVSASDMSEVVPNINNFNVKNLGFMQT